MNKGFEKVIKQKKLDKDSTMKITKNEMGERIFVSFSSNDGYFGNKEMQSFIDSISGIADIRKHFGLK